MPAIIIRTVANPALYASLQDGVTTETRHRTISGAVDRLRWIGRREQEWARSMGAWGRVEIMVDGRPLDAIDVVQVEEALAEEARDPQFSGGAGERALRSMIDG